MSEVTYLVPVSYETKNLGRYSFSLDLASIESLDENFLRQCINEKIQQFGKIFVQVRIGKEDLSLAPILHRCGFYFVESTIKPQINLKNNQVIKMFMQDKSSFIPNKYKQENFNLKLWDRDDKTTLNKIINIAEESFSDDRFHIDTNCPNPIANKRFGNWVYDLYSDCDVVFYYLEYLGETIAFICHKNQDLILAGFAKRYVNAGLGEFFLLSILEMMLNQGKSIVKTLISVNNISVLNLYSRMGFKFKYPSATFHYWSE